MSTTLEIPAALRREPRPGDCCGSMLDESGDSKFSWNPDDADDVALARGVFEKAKAKGMAAFRMGASGEKTTAMSEFDPKAAKVLFVPKLAGG